MYGFTAVAYLLGSMNGIFTYYIIYHKHQPQVDRYSSPMDPMGDRKYTGKAYGSSSCAVGGVKFVH